VSAAIDVVRSAADGKGVRIRAVLDPDAGLVKGDAGRLQQVMWNLLTNAVKVTPRGGSVQVSLRREHSSVRIQVSDTGKGIAPAFLPRIFERFTQEDGGNARRTGGLGLGLAIVKNLVELHGGTVTVHSEGENQGASFVVSLPLAPVRAPAVPAASSHGSSIDQLTLPAELSGLKVVVVDDEKDARELVQAVLEKGGAQVFLAESAATALELVRTEKPDVIVSDIGMPDEDGYTFIRKLRARPREQGGRTPAIALTAYARAEDRRKALLAGFHNHAAKPIEPQELVIVIANLAGRYS
jgi:CheY-like chemotaxis protein